MNDSPSAEYRGDNRLRDFMASLAYCSVCFQYFSRRVSLFQLGAEVSDHDVLESRYGFSATFGAIHVFRDLTRDNLPGHHVVFLVEMTVLLLSAYVSSKVMFLPDLLFRNNEKHWFLQANSERSL